MGDPAGAEIGWLLGEESNPEALPLQGGRLWFESPDVLHLSIAWRLSGEQSGAIWVQNSFTMFRQLLRTDRSALWMKCFPAIALQKPFQTVQTSVIPSC